MLENNIYNLMNQLVEENKSLWRMKDLYQKDAEGCEDCHSFWGRMVKDKEAHIAEMMELLGGHM